MNTGTDTEFVCPDEVCVFNRKCYDPNAHLTRHRALMLEPNGIIEWIRRQSEAGDFGGTCEFDHDTALELVEKLMLKLELEQRK